MSADTIALVTGLLGCLALVLNHWESRPSKQVSERLDKIDAHNAAQDGRLAQVEGWISAVKRAD